MATLRRRSGPKVFLAECGFLLVTALAALLVITFLFRLWDLRPSVPLEYDRHGDGHWIELLIKTMAETGDVYVNPRLGFPNTYVGYDYPVTEVLHTAVLRAMSRVLPDSGTVLNVFTIACYPACALTAALALRLLGVSRAGAFVCGQSFAFLPFHFFRGQAHLFYSAAYAVPLMMTALWWLAAGTPLVRRAVNPLTRRGWAAAGFMVLAGLSGVYQVAFGCGFLLLIASVRWLRTSRAIGMVPVGVYGLLLLGTCLATLVPVFRYDLVHGSNDQTARRSASESDFYGLRLTQLVLPNPAAQIEPVRALRQRYSNEFPGITENDYASLGLIGTFGLALMTLHAARALLGRRHDRRLALAFVLVAGTIAVANVGGLGSLFALIVTPSIRAMNRVSIDLAFLCLLAAALWADRRMLPWRSAGRRGRPLAVWATVLGVGLFDQTSPDWTPHYERQRVMWEGDHAFVTRIEQSVPAGAAIFVMPGGNFPDGKESSVFSSTDLLTGYLHSTTLKWSNHLAGRGAEEWERRTLDLKSVTGTVARLRAAGFAGIYLDRRGDVPDEFIKELLATHGPHFTSPNGQTAFVRITP